MSSDDIIAKSILNLHLETNIPIQDIIDALVPKKAKPNTKRSITKILNLSPVQLGTYMNPVSHYKQARVLLIKSQATILPNQSLRWNISLVPNTVTNQQHIPVEYPPMYIHQIQTLLVPITIIRANVRMKNSEGQPITNANGFGQPQYNYGNCFTILIEEYEAQSFVARNGKKFHFSYSPFYVFRTEGFDYIEFVSHLKGQGYYQFTKPILFSNTMTITVGDPFNTMDANIIQNMTIPLIFYYL